MTRVHEIKINKDFADSVHSGEKTFELRNNDRGYQKGDIVRFIPIDRLGCEMISHPLREKEYEITYVINGFGLDKDWVVFSIKPKSEEDTAIEAVKTILKYLDDKEYSCMESYWCDKDGIGFKGDMGYFYGGLYSLLDYLEGNGEHILKMSKENDYEIDWR